MAQFVDKNEQVKQEENLQNDKSDFENMHRSKPD
jgi:hypothetical protein